MTCSLLKTCPHSTLSMTKIRVFVVHIWMVLFLLFKPEDFKTQYTYKSDYKLPAHNMKALKKSPTGYILYVDCRDKQPYSCTWQFVKGIHSCTHQTIQSMTDVFVSIL